MYYQNVFKILRKFQLLWLDRSYKYSTKENPWWLYRFYLKN